MCGTTFIVVNILVHTEQLLDNFFFLRSVVWTQHFEMKPYFEAHLADHFLAGSQECHFQPAELVNHIPDT